MDNRGFTLIELLASIVILGVITSITIVTVNNSYKNAKGESEKVVIENITKAIDSYIAEYSSEIIFDTEEQDFEKGTDENKYTVKVKSGTQKKNGENKEDLTLNNTIIKNNYLSKNDIVNPKLDNAQADLNTIITIYKDSDNVYCFETKIQWEGKEESFDTKINTCPF